MKIDNVITLKNGTNYLLLTELKLLNNKYFFCVEMDENGERPVANYSFIKEVKKNSKIYASLVKNNYVIKKLYGLLVKEYSEINF